MLGRDSPYEAACMGVQGNSGYLGIFTPFNLSFRTLAPVGCRAESPRLFKGRTWRKMQEAEELKL
jgi:hypothetical protein